MGSIRSCNKSRSRSLSLQKSSFYEESKIDEHLVLLKKDSNELFPIIKRYENVSDAPKWPTECQVLDKRVKHIDYVPALPEPYYDANGKEPRFKPYGNKRGKIVYDYNISNLHCFHKSCDNGSCDCGETCDVKEESLKFESRFESGNLTKAVKISPEYYELYLRNDLYTFRQRQWFYFKVSNMDMTKTYRFSIVNMSKDEKLYNEGMRPLMYSRLEVLFKQIGWKRCGDNIKYFCNEFKDDIDNTKTYTLTFTIEFPYNNDDVYFAYNYPYTYSDLQEYLLELKKNTLVSSYTSIRLLCKSLADNNVYCITIHNKSKKTKKKAVIITARIHAGGTPSSWMMKGFIEFLIGNSTTARQLRDLFVFQLIPMVNPDGVIVGNTCCSLAGKDLNGEFKNTVHKRYPSVWYIKLLAERMIKEYGVIMFCDLRGQNVTHNVFLYGCDVSRGLNKRSDAHLFPTMLYRNAPDKFSLSSCKYNNENFHGSTSRVVMWLMGIPNSFTIEASYGGSSLNSRAGTHFSTKDYEQMAHTFCATFLDFCSDSHVELLAKDVESVSIKSSKSIRPHTDGGDRYSNNDVVENDGDIDYSMLLEMSSNDLFPIVQMRHISLQRVQWPAECQVLYPKVNHIYFVPSEPEPYYVSTGKEARPKPVGEKRGKIVYEYRITALRNFHGTICNRDFNFQSPCIDTDEYTLKFESRFESGNLAKAIKIHDLYYELYIRNDFYTIRQKQWFYFRITNMRKDLTYRLSIVNMTKKENLYKQGMKPLMYSTKDAAVNKIGWRRCGDNINYFCNEGIGIDEGVTYTLTFTIEFPYNDDTVYFAYCYPYTYSDLKDYLLGLCNHPTKSTYTTIRQLCKTLAGNDLYYVTITSPRYKRKLKSHLENKKKTVIVTARVHPAETPSSWMMKGFLDFLTGETSSAKLLREKFVFKLVPMINPDGVIVGNTRYSLAGRDLNGQYKYGSRKSYPTVWYTKLLIRRTLERCGVALYCDLHAQFSIHNIFIYGCDKRRGLEKFFEAQVLPSMLQRNASDKFSLESCKYNNERIKEGTARMEAWMMGVSNSFTIEASFAGSKLGDRSDTHFNVQDYENMGHSFCETILEYFDSVKDHY